LEGKCIYLLEGELSHNLAHEVQSLRDGALKNFDQLLKAVGFSII